MVKFAESVDDFNNVIQANKYVLIDYTASWCGPCKFIAPMFEELANENESIAFLKVDVDELSEVSESAGIRAMPTFLMYENGQKVDEIVGANITALKELVRKYALLASQ